MPSLLVVVAVAVLMYNWTIFLPQLYTEKVDLIVHGMSFLGCFLLMIFMLDHPLG